MMKALPYFVGEPGPLEVAGESPNDAANETPLLTKYSRRGELHLQDSQCGCIQDTSPHFILLGFTCLYLWLERV